MSGDSFSVNVKDGQVSLDYSVSSSMGLGFRALVNGKMGYASTQVLDDEALELLIHGAAENAALIENEDEQFIFAGSAFYPEIAAYNPAIDQVTAAEKIDMARRLEKACVSIDPRVKACEMVEVFSMASEKRIVNSRGLDAILPRERHGPVCRRGRSGRRGGRHERRGALRPRSRKAGY